MNNYHFDIAIVGGGMVGATAALSYAQLGLSVAIIEAIAPQQSASISFDQRAIALSASSTAIFKSLGLWNDMAAFATPIHQIHVSDQGQMGFTRFKNEQSSNKQIAKPLGEVIPLKPVGSVLWQQIQKQSLITSFCPHELVSVKNTNENCQLIVKSIRNPNETITIKANLVLASDGTFSKTAQLLDIPVEQINYQQHAIIANIVTSNPHQNKAFERFTTNGPLALLPLAQNQMSLVWCHHSTESQQIMQLDDHAFLTRLQKAFGFRLGKIIKVSQRHQYPLGLRQAKKPYMNRVLLLGNAARTLHPIAGQGFNLGLRDIAMLNDLLRKTILEKQIIGDEPFLKNYVASREKDWQQTVLITDSLVRLFNHDFLPLVLARNKMMSFINYLPPVKQYFANAAMGYQGQSSRLVRGLVNEQVLRK